MGNLFLFGALIIPRYMLCAESNEERDIWVDMLVRYFMGKYSEESLNIPAS